MKKKDAQTKVYELLLYRTAEGYKYSDFVRTRMPIYEEKAEIRELIQTKQLDKVVERMAKQFIEENDLNINAYCLVIRIAYTESEEFELCGFGYYGE